MFDSGLVMRLLPLLWGVLVASVAVAVPVSLEQAQTAVRNWLSTDPALGCPLGMSVRSARTSSVTNGATCHVVQLAEGGFVVTSTDTRLEPVIAFSEGSDLVEDDRNPLWALLKRDLVARARSTQVGGASLQSVTPATVTLSATESKWAKLLSGEVRLQGVTSVSDVRVAPLVLSKWGQDQNSIYLDVGEENCYNYFTPNNYPCGCVATALAQVMRYHCYPPRPVKVVSQFCAVNGTTRKLAMKGGTYDYENMPLVPEAYPRVSWYSGGASSAQRQEIGKLTYDCGVAMQTNWRPEGGGAGGAAAHAPLKSIFDYKNAHTTANGLSDAAYRSRIILTNLDARYPVLVGINGEYGGHEVIADGYGYSGDTLYTHLNLGWSGLDDAWYALPDIDVEESFSVVTHLVYNVFPQEQGEIVSGRIVSSTGMPVTGAPVEIRKGTTKVKESVTDSRGIFSFVVSSVGSYTVVATYGEGSVVRSVNVTASVDSSVALKVGSYSYYPDDPAPNCGNVHCGDLVLSSVASVDTPMLSPADCLFHPTTNVTITCATEGSMIRYTVDGTDPTETSTVYAEPIVVTTTTTIKARAFKSGYSSSPIVSATYTHALPGDCFADPLRISGANGAHTIPNMEDFTLELNEPWHTLQEDGSYSYQFYSAWYEWMAPGSGTVSFTTRCAGGGFLYPTAVAVYSGDDWAKSSRLAMSKDHEANGNFSTTVSLVVQEGVTYRIAGVVLHELPGERIAFSLTWRGNLTTTRVATSGTNVSVPYTWLDRHFPGTHSAADYETIAQADPDGDGFPTWQEYVLDTDPNDPMSTLTASIRLVDGAPVVEWNHTNANIEAIGYRYVPRGKASLTSDKWLDAAPSHRFFKVFVEPCGK